MHKPFFRKKAKQQRSPPPPKDSYIIYTDGSALENPGPGGYGVVAIYDNIVVDMSKGYVHAYGTPLWHMSLCYDETPHTHLALEQVFATWMGRQLIFDNLDFGYKKPPKV